MRSIHTAEVIAIPKGVEVELSGRKVTVTGPRGTNTRDFSFIPLEITRSGKAQIKVAVWFGNHKHVACIRTICSHISNMMKGVTKGFEYKMRATYAHFPINVTIVDSNKCIEIRNFIGEKIVRRVPMLEGVTIDVTGQKDELVLRGTNLQHVSQSAASIQNITKVKNKDIRMFLDGIYVSERTSIDKDE